MDRIAGAVSDSHPFSDTQCDRGTTVALLACAFGLVLLLAQCEIGKIAAIRYGQMAHDERDQIHE